MFDINHPSMKPYRDGTLHIAKDFTKSEGMLRDFIRFLHSCPDGNLTREQTAATVVLTLWQAAGRAWTRNPPSMLLVHANPGADPLDELARYSAGRREEYPEGNEGAFVQGDHTDLMGCPRANMRDMVKRYDNAMKVDPGATTKWVEQCSKFWLKAKHRGFGRGRAGQYARMWDPVLGLVTDDDGSIILRIERECDLAQLREDIMNHPERFTLAQGRCNTTMGPVSKSPAVSGSLKPAQLDAGMVAAVLNEGLPFLFLPHASEQSSIKIPDRWFLTSWEFENWIKNIRNTDSDITRIRTATGNLAGYLHTIEDNLRRRLVFLPSGYDYFIRSTVRQLPHVCVEIAQFLAVDNSRIQDVTALTHDLTTLTARGIALGVESLMWHGWILYSGDELKIAQSLLAWVREHGTTTRRDIQRKLQKLTAEQLDTMLAKIADGGLVTLKGHKVHAVGFDTFVRMLAAHPDYPPVELKTSESIEEWDKEK